MEAIAIKFLSIFLCSFHSFSFQKVGCAVGCGLAIFFQVDGEDPMKVCRGELRRERGGARWSGRASGIFWKKRKQKRKPGKLFIDISILGRNNRFLPVGNLLFWTFAFSSSILEIHCLHFFSFVFFEFLLIVADGFSPVSSYTYPFFF